MATLFAFVFMGGCAVKDSTQGCPVGYTQCGEVCVDVNSDAYNCGLCGNACSAGGVCAAGACSCQGGLAACGATCADTASDGNNCGTCGNVCPTGLFCGAGVCAATCPVGTEACGSSCVDKTSNVFNCGQCGNACPSGLGCAAGVCACPVAGQKACGGACVDTLSNAANCGECGVVCGGGTVCTAGACQCPAGMSCDVTGTGGVSGTGGAPGTGGVVGTGGAATGGAGTGGGTGEACVPGVDCGGYLMSGSWKGYAFTSAYGAATILPANFATAYDFPVCANGTVPASATGANGAMVGWSVNQAEAPENAPSNSVTPTADGILVSITNTSNAQLRLQIQGPNGATSASDRWCAQIGTGGSNIFVPYSSFNTVCWPGETGTPYTGQPITQVLVTVPAAAASAVNYNFCINSIEEADDTGGGGMGCNLSAPLPGSALSGSLAYPGNQYQRVAVNTGSKQYFVQNNVFTPDGNNPFNISYNGASFTITQQSGSRATNGAPIAYPSLFIGSNGGNGLATPGSNLSRAVNSLTSVPTALKWSKGSAGNYNVAYDVWFAPNGPDNGPGSRSFLMVWFSKSGSIYAEGEGEGHSGGVFSTGGRSFNTYVSQQFEGRPIISYVATSEIMEWSFDLLTFINDAKTRSSSAQSAVITSNLHLTNVFAGFEVWSGSTNLKVDNFCIDVQ